MDIVNQDDSNSTLSLTRKQLHELVKGSSQRLLDGKLEDLDKKCMDITSYFGLRGSQTSKWLPKTTPHPASHGQRTPTNTTTPTQTRIQPTQIQRTQATTPTTTRPTNQQQIPLTTTQQLIQLRSPNLPRRGRPILVKRQQQSPQQSRSQHLEHHQRPISLKNYEILNQESYAQQLNQSQVTTSQNQQQLSNQLHVNPIQLSNQSALTLNRNHLLNRTHQLQNQASSSQNSTVNQTQLNCTTTQPNLNLARTEFLRNQTQQLLNCTTTQPNLNRARTEFLRNQTQQRSKQILQANQLRELQIQQQKTLLEQQNNQQETILESQTPIYQIISVPFLTRSFLPTTLMKQGESKTNGLVKLKQIIVNANGKNGQRIILCPEQKNILTRLNLLNQQQPQSSSSNILNTTTTVESLSETPTNLNLTKTTTTTTPSTKMMDIQLSGDEYQDLSGTLQIAAAEELMHPRCLDDYLIETNNINDFDITKGTYRLQELNEMTINQMNVNYGGNQLQLLPENGQEQEQLLLKEIPGEENFYNILRMPYSEELVTLTQPLSIIGHETTSLESESLFNTQYIDIKSDSLDNNSTSSYIEIPPGSPLPTERDCIATSELHNNKYTNDKCQSNSSIQDDELDYYIEYSPSQSMEVTPSEPQLSPVCQSNSSSADEEALDLEQILEQLEATAQQQQQTNANLKRSSDHFGVIQTKVAKKSRMMNIPMNRLVTNASCEDILTTTKVPDTPEVCAMVDSWLTEDNDPSIHSLSSSPSWCGTPFAPPDFVTDSFTLIEPKYENPPSIASSYICEEPLYATPSPSNSSSSTLYSTNPNSPAVSQYGSNNGSTRKPRGRPPKQHSDMPNPEILRTLPESERKRIEDRCKNNEASRQSRQKNKEKQMILMAEEDHEERRNEELRNRMKHLEKQHLKLKKILYRKLGNTN